MTGNQNISVNFKVSGGDLAAYMDNIKRKSSDIASEAIRGAIAQSEKGKEQIQIINQQIAAIEKKARVETQAYRSLALERRESELKANKDFFEGKRNDVYARTDLSEGQLKERINSLNGRETEAAQRIKANYQDSLTVLRERDRESKLQTSLSKEQIETIRRTARENVQAIQSGDKTLAQVITSAQTEDEKLVARLTQEGLEQEKRKMGGGEKGGGVGNFLGSLLTVDNFTRAVNSFSQLVGTNNGFDAIKPAASMAGQIVGGIVGAVVGGLVGNAPGAFAGAGIGSSLLSSVTGAWGEVEQKGALLKEDYWRTRGRLNAITGGTFNGSYDVSNMANVGVNVIDFMKLQGEFARRRGYGYGSDATTRDAIYAERGYGVDQGTTAALIEMQRSAKENNRDLAQLIGGVLDKGKNTYFANGDNTFLNEFLNKFSSLQKELLRTQTHVSTGLTYDVLSRFNSVGGMFDTRDPRSAGLISTINNDLINPSSENTRALSYYVLRQQNPGASLFQLRKMMQQGIGNPGYLQGMMKQLMQMGNGDDEMGKMQLAGMLPGVPFEAIEQLYNNKGKILSGKFSDKELRATLNMRGAAEGNTAEIDKIIAQNTNQFLNGEPIKAAAESISKAFKEMLMGAVITMKDGNTITLMSREDAQRNTTTSLKQQKDQTIANLLKPIGVLGGLPLLKQLNK